jgi:flavin reductase (DIM6/NTAB) family NADH-FMN oxidoreductase RutF
VVEQQVDAATLRRVMGTFATGVAVVTTDVDGVRHGMTLNSLTSVSLTPPLVLVCLAAQSRTAGAVVGRGLFAVNLLASHQERVSRRFAAPHEDHFTGVSVREGAFGLPVLSGALAHLICRVDAVHDGGDHVIVVGRVLECSAASGDPLLFFRGAYGRYAQWEESDPAQEAGFWFGW